MVPNEFEQKLHRLVDVFLEENAKINLSALRTEELCWTGNVLDSLAFLDLLPSLPPATTVLDVGTGGGFPLLPLAICLPSLRFTGLDATEKKVEAVRRIAGSLQLINVDCIQGRAEEAGKMPKFREQFDIVLSRAVAEINVLLEYTSPFVKPGGFIVLWKSMHIDRELTDSLLARAEFSCHLIKQHAYDLGEKWGKRQLLVFSKTAHLSAKYPRDIGIPGKKPLL